MSTGWAWWVMALIVINLGVIFFLFLWAPRAKVPTLPDGTTGHTWAHGEIREGVHRLPLWWIVLSFAMFFAGFIYLILYPGFGNTRGILDWTAHREHDEAVVVNDTRLEPLLQRVAGMTGEQVAGDAGAVKLGERLFVDNCAACHGRAGHGNPLLGAPDLTDADWLYGGADQDITMSIRNGRSGVMPAWGALGEATVKNLVQYVLKLSGQSHDAEAATAGETAFMGTCIACHGPEGKGNPLLGAPNLSDDVWLYGATPEAIGISIRDGRQGHMPAWSPRLSDAEIHVLVGYVHHLSRQGQTRAP